MVIGRLNFCDPKLLGIEREGRNAWRWICIAGIALILVDSVVVVLLLLQQRIRRPSDAKEDDVLRFRSILISIDIDTVGHVTSYSCSDSNSDRRVVQVVVYGRWSVGAIVLLDVGCSVGAIQFLRFVSLEICCQQNLSRFCFGGLRIIEKRRGGRVEKFYKYRYAIDTTYCCSVFVPPLQ